MYPKNIGFIQNSKYQLNQDKGRINLHDLTDRKPLLNNFCFKRKTYFIKWNTILHNKRLFFYVFRKWSNFHHFFQKQWLAYQTKGTIKTQNLKDKTIRWNKDTQMTRQHEPLWKQEVKW